MIGLISQQQQQRFSPVPSPQVVASSSGNVPSSSNQTVGSSSSPLQTSSSSSSTSIPSSTTTVSGIKRRASSKSLYTKEDVKNFNAPTFDPSITSRLDLSNQFKKDQKDAKDFIYDNFGDCNMEEHLMYFLVLAGIVLIKKEPDNDGFLSHYFDHTTLSNLSKTIKESVDANKFGFDEETAKKIKLAINTYTLNYTNHPKVAKIKLKQALLELELDINDTATSNTISSIKSLVARLKDFDNINDSKYRLTSFIDIFLTSLFDIPSTDPHCSNKVASDARKEGDNDSNRPELQDQFCGCSWGYLVYKFIW